MRRLGVIAVVTVAAAGWSCRLEQSFRCEVDDNCAEELGNGICEPSGYCSFDDPECDSGRRYGKYAAQELAGVCVSADASASSSTTGAPPPMSSTSADPLDTTDTGPEGTTVDLDGTTTQVGESSSDGPGESSTGPPPLEVCDGIDNDGDGLIDEYSSANESCEGCVLSEVEGQPLWACPMPTGSWDGAQQWCEDQFSARLARLDSDALRQAASDLAITLTRTSMSPGYWIGGRFEGTEWIWPNGALIDTLYWAPGQPDGNVGEDCLLVGPAGWRDGFCETDNLPALCGVP